MSKQQENWQARCLELGFTYVRLSDDHYVIADVPEMARLLGELLGVEVRSRDDDSYGETISELQEQVGANVNAFHRAYEAEQERDQLKAENEALRKDAERYRFVRDLAWYVDRAAFVYELGNSRSPWAGERHPVDADEVEDAIDAALAKEAK